MHGARAPAYAEWTTTSSASVRANKRILRNYGDALASVESKQPSRRAHVGAIALGLLRGEAAGRLIAGVPIIGGAVV